MTNQRTPETNQLQDDESTIYLHAALETQNTIGWENFFRARITNASWQLCQPEATRTPCKNHSMDLGIILRLLAIPQHNPIWQSSSLVKQLRLKAKVREVYEACYQLPTTHKQHHQYTPIKNLILQPPSIRTIWLTQAQQTLQEHRKSIAKGLIQQPITRYFRSTGVIKKTFAHANDHLISWCQRLELQ
jgi:hypothetical protein